MVIAINMYWPD